MDLDPTPDTPSPDYSNSEGQKVRRKRNRPMNQPNCEVCGDQVNIKSRSGIRVCSACSTFFRNNAHKRYLITCQRYGICEITVETRKDCGPCRLEKCEEVGMGSQKVKKTKCEVCGVRTSLKVACEFCNKFFERVFGTDLDCTNEKKCSIIGWREINCAACRLERFLRIGGLEAYQQIHGKLPDCEVCGQLTSLINKNGVTCCHACHTFVRAVSSNTNLARGKFCNFGNCLINQWNRTTCPACRYKKYMEVRMKRNPTEPPEVHHAQTTVYPVPSQTHEQAIFEHEPSHVPSTEVVYDDQMEFRSLPPISEVSMSTNTTTTSQSMPPVPLNQQKIRGCEICGQQTGLTNNHGITGCHACHGFIRDRLLGRTPVNRKCIVGGNCQINWENRKKCSPCRYNKYWNLRMQRSGEEPRPEPPTSSRKVSECEVCGQQGCTSMRNGVKCCYACHSFFKHKRRRATVKECKNFGRCEINVDNRAKCPACRYNKHMNIKMERSTCISEIQPPLDETPSSLPAPYPEQLMPPTYSEVSDTCYAQTTFPVPYNDQMEFNDTEIRCQSCGQNGDSYKMLDGFITCSQCELSVFSQKNYPLNECHGEDGQGLTMENQNLLGQEALDLPMSHAPTPILPDFNTRQDTVSTDQMQNNDAEWNNQLEPCPQFYDQDHSSVEMINEFYPSNIEYLNHFETFQDYPIVPNPESPVCLAHGEEWNLQLDKMFPNANRKSSECPDPKLQDSEVNFDPDKDSDIQLELYDDSNIFDEDYFNQLIDKVLPDPEEQKMVTDENCPTPKIEYAFNYPPISPAKDDQSWNLQLDGLISPEKCCPNHNQCTDPQFENVDPGMCPPVKGQ
ncbi:unnamed protein product [Caenorhabditis brenneri]